MSGFEVAEPIICGPYDEPTEHWHIVEGETPNRLAGRRPATYYYRPPGPVTDTAGDDPGTLIELKLVNRVRERLKAWQAASRPGVTPGRPRPAAGATSHRKSWSDRSPPTSSP